MGDRYPRARPPRSTGSSAKTTALAPISSFSLSGATSGTGDDTTGTSGGATVGAAWKPITSELKEQQQQRDANVDVWSRICENESVELLDEGGVSDRMPEACASVLA